MSHGQYGKDTSNRRNPKKDNRGGTPNSKDVIDSFLEEKAKRIESCFISEASSSLKLQIAIGREVESVRSNSGYGDAAIPKLAARLMVTPHSLYRLGTRAAAFDDADIEAALEIAESIAYKLTSSALDELVAVSDRERRIVLLEQCVENRWTIKRLRGEIQGERRARVAAKNDGTIPWLRLTADAEALRQVLLSIVAESNDSDWCSESGTPAAHAIWTLAEAILQVAQSWDRHLKSGIETVAVPDTLEEEEPDIEWVSSGAR